MSEEKIEISKREVAELIVNLRNAENQLEAIAGFIQKLLSEGFRISTTINPESIDAVIEMLEENREPINDLHSKNEKNMAESLESITRDIEFVEDTCEEK